MQEQLMLHKQAKMLGPFGWDKYRALMYMQSRLPSSAVGPAALAKLSGQLLREPGLSGNKGETVWKRQDVKGYNIRRKGKKGKIQIAEEKIPDADLDDPRFSALFTSSLFALDPTDPQFKRSAAYARQLSQKQNGDQRSSKQATAKSDDTAKSGALDSKKEKHDLSSAIRSVKMKIQQKDTEKKQGKKPESSALVQRIKKKAKAMAK
ncbi:PREDICTED: ESF1 homolog [Tarenaya hassleriana]|uniref:ESF1 homolog n=1 Tax=Tarenaya hassleriana TaxID=28532 RepID=UPI00053C5C63|nr:PREDICTED: ESF1 homolog [Tarenaya hassleriana]